MIKQPQPNHGFTLIELLLYASLTGTILLAISVFLSLLLSVRVKSQTTAEVEQQGLSVSQQIAQASRNAGSINSPSSGNTGSLLALSASPSANNPTVFDLQSGIIRIQLGSSSAVALTSSQVVATNLSFHNLTNSLKFQFTLSRLNPLGRNEYDETKTFYGTATIRQ